LPAWCWRAQREREISVRFSLGASRLSLIAQLLTERFVLALAGASLGLLAAAAGSRALRTLAKSLPRAEEIGRDWRMVLYTFCCSVIVTLLFGLLPAFRATRQGIAQELARGGRALVSTRNPLQWLLVAAQVALAASLMVGAGLLLRTFEETEPSVSRVRARTCIDASHQRRGDGVVVARHARRLFDRGQDNRRAGRIAREDHRR
jgi:hypothetical protein